MNDNSGERPVGHFGQGGHEQRLRLEQTLKERAGGNEEFASELLYPGSSDLSARFSARPRDAEGEAVSGGAWVGALALLCGVLSLLWLPMLFGPAAAVIGTLAFFRGSRSPAIWGTSLGLLSIIGYVWLVPAYA